MKRWIWAGIALGCATSAATMSADKKPYLALVGDLIGAAKSPEIMKEQCAEKFHGARKDNDKLFKEWTARHAEIFVAIDAQIARADERLQRQAGSAKLPPNPAASVTRAHLDRVFAAMTPADAREYCAQFPAVLEKKEREFGEITRLLADVQAADRELTARESAPVKTPPR
jgi:hypothetical protein